MISQKSLHKTVLITGASSGIGQACAFQLAALGARLILVARRFDRLQTLQKELEEKFNVNVHIAQCDITDHQAVEKMIAKIPSEFLPIDILINNAGLALGLDKAHEANLLDWEQMIDTNIKGVLYMTRAILPSMLTRNSGHILYLGSTAGHQNYPGGSVYCATKSAIHSMAKNLNQELVGTKIRSTEIAPGMVETEFSLVRFKGDESRAKKVYAELMPLTPDDVADAIVYAITRPEHVNIAQILLYSTDQALAVRPA